MSQEGDSPQERTPGVDGPPVISRESAHIAVDLGASSGRVVLGRVGRELVLEELHRFPNQMEERDGHLRWNPRLLLREIQTGIGLACESLAAKGGCSASVAGPGSPADAGSNAFANSDAFTTASHLPPPVTIGVDTWGVDYCLLDASSRLIEDPICYRDSRTTTVVEEVLDAIGADDLYQRTGTQLLHINTLFQLWSHVRSGNWPGDVTAICLMPDLFHLWLSGILNVEYTIATTSQLLRAGTNEWDVDLLSLIGLPANALPAPTEPGRRLGRLRPELLAGILSGGDPAATSSGADPIAIPSAGRAPDPGPKLEVVTPASHDTASAVVGTPLAEGWAFLSCGTWSLLGLELHEPELGTLARRYEFSNEGGPEGTVRFLKNVTGLWILNSCLELWRRNDPSIGLRDILHQLADVVPGPSFIDPDDPRFLAPGNMLREISEFLGETEQEVVRSPVDVTRVILDSLALRFAQIVDQLAEATGNSIPGIHAVGGGSQNHYLMQATANVCGLPVVAGPAEATALGNVMTQAIGVGSLHDLAAARRWAHAKISPRGFSPRHQEEWRAAHVLFERLQARGGLSQGE